MKVHLLSIDSPRAITGTLLADCGKEVTESRMVAMFDEVGMGQKLRLNVKGLCRECAEVERSSRYTYGICERRELKREEDLYI